MAKIKKAYIPEMQEMYDKGHTFYGIAYQLKQWYSETYTEDEVQKALGGVENNKIKKFR